MLKGNFSFLVLVMNLEKLTPAMRQYVQMKQQNPDCILLFRIGDFYEVFFEDAKICANVLDLIITSKNKNAETPIPMAWIPHHSVDKYIPRLIAQGYKVAIAEQTTDPIPGKIVERTIKSIITPWTYIQENQQESSYMLAITRHLHKTWPQYSIARGDFSLGNYMTKTFTDLGKLQKFILSQRPAEIIVDADIPNKEEITAPLQQYLGCLLSVYAVPVDPAHLITKICKIQQLSSFGKAVVDGRESALALLFAYIQHTQQQILTNVAKISFHSGEGMVLMDEVTVKNLELFSSSYEQSGKYSLFGILNTTKTAGGSRLLRELLAAPTNHKPELDRRLSHIGYYLQDWSTKSIHQTLGNFFDIPKLVSLILYRKPNYLPFVKLRTVLQLVFFALEWKIALELKRLGLSEENMIELKEIHSVLQTILKPDDQLIGENEYIADGANAEIDELRKLAYHSDDLLLQYQQELVMASGISNIKLKFVTNQGYFIELTSKDSELFDLFITQEQNKNLTPDLKQKFHLVRRQTLKGNQRYSSPYLDTMQWSILSAKEQLRLKEQDCLLQLKTFIQSKVESIATLSDYLSWLDVFSAAALFAQQHRYSKPDLTEDKNIVIQWGRHPVIEAFLPKDQPFIPNDLTIGGEMQSTTNGLIHIITGPNMGGKSTYLRQSALIVLLAHCGFYVPAEKAQIWLVDGIFARVGSGDIIAKNQSTFMTEMIEVANILNNATDKSFIIFDELGRGTSTYDGLALTKAILHYILHTLKAKTLIATHYHELVALEEESALIQNFSVSVYETEKEVVFMKKITAGGASKSYGIDVAKLAWIPKSILQEAKAFLAQLEQWKKSEMDASQPLTTGLFTVAPSQFPQQWQYEKVKSLLAGLDLNGITPLQALQLLMKIKEEL